MAKRKHINVAATIAGRKPVTVAYLILKNGKPYRYAQPATTNQKFGQLHMLATQIRRAAVRMEAQPNEPVPPPGYGLRRQPALDQVLVRDGFSPIHWQVALKGEQVVFQKFHDYIEGIRKP
jgi:hypothetical protein